MALAVSDIGPDLVHEYQQGVWADPVRWMREALGVGLWNKQREIAEAVRDNPLVAVRSGHSIGKSKLAACIVIWFLETTCPGYAVTTSSSWLGIKNVLWPEIRRTLRLAPAGHLLTPEPLMLEWTRGPQWGAFGVSAKIPENFSGFHTENGALVIVDEASALPLDIYDAIMGLMSTPGSRLLLLGNPLRPEGPFYEAFSSPKWKCFHISTLDSPNVVAGREVIPGLAGRAWVEERKAEWGENSPAYRARVLGEFPESAADVLVTLHEAEAAIGRIGLSGGTLQAGVDVARFGADRTVILVRRGGKVEHLEVHEKEDTMATAGRIKAMIEERGVRPGNVAVDDAGLGGGVTDRLREQGIHVNAVTFGAGAIDAERFANTRAECYWVMREAFKDAATEPACIPQEHSALARECAIAHYSYTSKGQVKIESKDEIRKRLGRSPDLADALALSYAAVPHFSFSVG